jgi:hypothetical protein
MPFRLQVLRRAPGFGLPSAEETSMPQFESPPVPISGRVVDEDSSHPLSGYRVRAVSEISGAGAETPQRTRLGESVSDRKGRFAIVFDDTEATRQQLRLLEREGIASLMLELEDPQGAAVALPESDDGSSSGPLILRVAVAREQIGPEVWAEVAARVREAGLNRVNELAAELTGERSDATLFADWGAGKRLSVLDTLRSAFLDPSATLRARVAPPEFQLARRPAARERYRALLDSLSEVAEVRAASEELDARLAAFTGLHEIDWAIDVDRLAAGEVVEAIGGMRSMTAMSGSGENFFDSAAAGMTDSLAQQLVQMGSNELMNYRNYLRAIFTGPHTDPLVSQRRADLKRRFHQSFTTTDRAERPTNSILIEILESALTSPTGAEYGFGFAVGDLPERGEMTDREYLDALIEKSGLSATQLSLRYRIDLKLPDTAMSSRMQQNIDTLQAFFRDGFQSVADPHPIFPAHRLGRAPFFLYFDEWRERNAIFHAENHLPMKNSFSTGVPEHNRALAEAACAWEIAGRHNKWFIKMMRAEEALAKGHEHFAGGQLLMARESYTEALGLGRQALYQSFDSLIAYEKGVWNDGTHAGTVIAALKTGLAQQFDALQSLELDSEEAITEWLGTVQVSPRYDPQQPAQHDFRHWLGQRFRTQQFALLRLVLFVAPTCLADVAAASGDSEGAIGRYEWTTRFLIARAEVSDGPGYRTVVYPNEPVGPHDAGGWLLAEGQLPYSADVSSSGKPRWPADLYSSHLYWDLATTMPLHELACHPVEARYFRMRHAAAALEWADAFYRTDQPDNIDRARELYKVALFLHGVPPGISPRWLLMFAPLVRLDPNPLIQGQVYRARQGIYQIDAGLNFYGFTDDFVPALRYGTLKAAADEMVAASESSQKEILAALAEIEAALRDRIVNTSLLEKAKLQAKVAQEQSKIAEVGVMVAQGQVQQIAKAIETTQESLDETDDLWYVLKGLFGGVVNELKSMAWASEPVGTQAATAAGFKEGELWLTGAATKAGIDAPGAAAGLGTAGTVLAGYALLIYAGYTTLEKMGAVVTTLKQQLKALKEKALPLANAQLDAARRVVTIAKLQKAIAEVDAKLALDLMHFQRVRFLNTDFWSEMLALARRMLQRYLFLGGRYAWLAERALSYEQARSLNLIRLDYFPRRFHGIGGAQLLKGDLVELEAARLGALQAAKPIVRTFSMAFDLPLQFAALKKSGRCLFHTSDADLLEAYPGTYGHRVRAVSLWVQTISGGAPFKGMLTHTGSPPSRTGRGTGDRCCAASRGSRSRDSVSRRI